jgi:hypothetical protein
MGAERGVRTRPPAHFGRHGPASGSLTPRVCGLIVRPNAARRMPTSEPNALPDLGHDRAGRGVAHRALVLAYGTLTNRWWFSGAHRSCWSG